jgi:2-dehydro-3-deoxyphosphooctonate aldolase (KDO 8-P synthase)
MQLNQFLPKNTLISPNHRFFLVAGPCVVESEDLCAEVAETVNQLCLEREIPYIFKASYRKANRSSINSFSGNGDIEGLELIQKIANKLQVPSLTDFHSAEEASLAAKYVDVLQIPAFLCRQTDILLAAGETGKVVNIKKGQFLSPEAMRFAAEKVASTGNKQILLTERGNSFGYQDLVVDFRAIPIMQETHYPVILDVTHALQQPNQKSGVTGGTPHMITTLASAGIAAGANGLFIETHPKPELALSDGANMLKLAEMERLLDRLVKIWDAVK